MVTRRPQRLSRPPHSSALATFHPRDYRLDIRPSTFLARSTPAKPSRRRHASDTRMDPLLRWLSRLIATVAGDPTRTLVFEDVSCLANVHVKGVGEVVAQDILRVVGSEAAPLVTALG